MKIDTLSHEEQRRLLKQLRNELMTCGDAFGDFVLAWCERLGVDPLKPVGIPPNILEHDGPSEVAPPKSTGEEI